MIREPNDALGVRRRRSPGRQDPSSSADVPPHLPAGANTAGVVVWTETSAFAVCAVPPAEWTVQGLMLWEGDWLLGPPPNDVFRTDLAALLAVVSP
jgi:hypothetical protein